MLFGGWVERFIYLWTMSKLMTVREYASHIGKSVPLVYKRITEGKIKPVKKYGKILIPSK